SVVRSVIENGLYAGVLPLKVFYIAPNFRYEKPQAGRLREHHQFGVEYFGAASPLADAEVISLADTFLARLGIDDVTAAINSIGCPKCRKGYQKALTEYYSGHVSELCPTCVDRLGRNPLRLLDCKEEKCSALASAAPKTVDYLCDECAQHFETLKAELDRLGVRYRVDTGIVRGLDYYTKTVFEFITGGIGAQSAICAGGRYDGLCEELGGPKLPGLGFGSGIERLLLTMAAKGAKFPEGEKPLLFAAALGTAAAEKVSELVCGLRRAGIHAERDTTGRSLKAQMKYADKLGCRYTLIIGDNELDAGRAGLRCMADGSCRSVELDCEKLAGALSADI
ncbi:MAG: histidine--tRNA ligase, partial [Eubacteriales bacterium]